MCVAWSVLCLPTRRRGYVQPHAENDTRVIGPENNDYLINTEPDDNEPLTVLQDWQV